MLFELKSRDVKYEHKPRPSINRLSPCPSINRLSPCIIYEVVKILIHHMDVLFIYKQPNINKFVLNYSQE
jgi:hypothetical protein